ncbi:MAG TPA: hypothetical protein VGG01_11095 [Xanthobacteraceae bacterium]|jgi:hypothetical protein
MSTKLALTAAALVAVLAGPALAHGRPTEHARIMHSVPANAFASMRVDAPAPIADPYRSDFQLQGRF